MEIQVVGRDESSTCPEDCGECEEAEIEEPAADMADDVFPPDIAGEDVATPDAALDGDAPDVQEYGIRDPGGDDGPGTGYETEGG